jgi:uncharacterized protein (TIGR01777 family)
MKLLISGASGLLGKRLTHHFETIGATVLPITRVTSDLPTKTSVAWNPTSGWLDTEQMEGAEAIIHLAGENVAEGRWSAAKKDRILSSRVVGTHQIVSAIAKLNAPPKILFNASGTGFYGHSEQELRDESHPAGKGFLASVCVAWEKEATKVATYGVRPILLRFGVILDPDGGALKKMLLPFRMGLGGRIGTGEQFFPWIAAPEIPQILETLILQAPNQVGPINMVAPQQVTNREFTQALASHLHRPAVIPVPEFAIRMLLGEMGEEMLLGSCRPVPKVLESIRYPFLHPTLESSFQSLLPR